MVNRRLDGWREGDFAVDGALYLTRLRQLVCR
jgi:hypothetical protein